MTISEMVKEYRKTNQLKDIDPNDSIALTRRMNLVIDKFEQLYKAAGFGFTKEGDPVLVKKNDPEAIFRRAISLVYVIIDWSIGSGRDFDKDFERMHKAVMERIRPEEGIQVDSAGNIKVPDTLEPDSLNN